MTHEAHDQWLTLPEADREPEIRLYLARPTDEEARPSVVVIHEAFGLDEHIQDVTRRFASLGYVAVAPDLFWLEPFGRTVMPDEVKEAMRLRWSLPPERRADPGAVEEVLGRLPEERSARLREIMAWSARRNMDALVPALERTLAWCRQRLDTTDAVGTVGFCFGGGMVLRLAFAGADLDAAVPFYGSNPALDQAGNVSCPLLLIYGRQDPFIMPGVPALLGAMQEAQLTYGMHVYEEAGHAFLNDQRPEVYHETSAHDAWQHTIQFFDRCLH